MAMQTCTPYTRALFLVLACAVGFATHNTAAEPTRRATVLVNPHANDHGTAKTIQQGIDMVAAGGRVLVLPGTYEEALVIGRPVTLEAVARNSGPVIVVTDATQTTAIRVTSAEPVVVRGLSVRYGGANGIRGDGAVDLTVENVSVTAVNPAPGANHVVAVMNETPTTGRARFVVRRSFLDGGIAFRNSPTPAFAQSFGVRAGGDVDALIEHNVVRRTGGACIFVNMEGNKVSND